MFCLPECLLDDVEISSPLLVHPVLLPRGEDGDQDQQHQGEPGELRQLRDGLHGVGS